MTKIKSINIILGDREIQIKCTGNILESLPFLLENCVTGTNFTFENSNLRKRDIFRRQRESDVFLGDLTLLGGPPLVEQHIGLLRHQIGRVQFCHD